jgi:hypothetical protein
MLRRDIKKEKTRILFLATIHPGLEAGSALQEYESHPCAVPQGHGSHMHTDSLGMLIPT